MSTPPTFSEIQAFVALVDFARTVNFEDLEALEAALFRGISCHPEVPDSIRKLQEDLKEALG